MSSVKRGDLVEFTNEHHMNYPPADESLIRFGVAIEDEYNGAVTVMLADGSTARAIHIYAYAWMGWIPEGLEPILEQINPLPYDEDYDY